MNQENKQNKNGFSLIELIIGMSITCIILTSIYILYFASHNHYLLQEAIVDMHNNARITMEFITRELKNALSIDPNSFSSSNIIFYSNNHNNITGISTGGNGSNTLKDINKSWNVNEWGNKYITITGGTGIGQVKKINSNTANELILTSNWDIMPDNSSIYQLDVVRKRFKRTNDNILRYSKGGSTNQPFADNISDLVFTKNSTAKKIDIKLTARTAKKDPSNNQYHTYTLKSSLILRN